MRVKLGQVGEGGGCTPTPFHYITITSKVAVYAPAEWADTLTLFHLFQYMYSVVVAVDPDLLNQRKVMKTECCLSSGLRIRITSLLRIGIQLYTSVRIQIRILLLIKALWTRIDPHLFSCPGSGSGFSSMEID